MKGFRLILFIVTLIAAGGAIAQNSRSSDDTFWVDALTTIGRMNRAQGGIIKEFHTNVHAYQGEFLARTGAYEIDLKSDNGVIVTADARARFFGNAVFKDSSRTLHADELTYYYKRKELFATGNVEVTEEGRMFKADEVHYHKPNRLLTATGNVYVYDDSVRSTVTGGQAVFNDSTNDGIITGDPVLTRVDSLGKVLTITCDDTIQLVKAEKTVKLWSNVVVTQDSMQVAADHAVYDDSVEIIYLVGDPTAHHVGYEPDQQTGQIRRLESEVAGDSMRIYVEGRKIKRLIVNGFANSASVSTDSITGSLVDRTLMNSENLRVELEDQKVVFAAAEGAAESFYLTHSTDTDNIFANEARGDTLYFFFEEGKARSLRMSGIGGSGARGKYYEYTPIVEDTLITVPEPIPE